MPRKLILYIATSLDGYIAKHDDDLSFLSLVHKDGEDYGYSDFLSSIDTVIIGRRTYDWIVTQTNYPHEDIMTYIISRTKKQDSKNKIFYNGNIKDLIYKLKSEAGSNIFCDGGSEIVNLLLKDDLIDEFIISVVPVLVGDGISLFRKGGAEFNLKLITTRTYDTGLVQLHYKRIKK